MMVVNRLARDGRRADVVRWHGSAMEERLAQEPYPGLTQARKKEAPWVLPGASRSGLRGGFL